MSAPRLQDVLEAHRVGNYSWGPEGCTYPCEWDGYLSDPAAHPAHQAAMWREVCTVRTAEQLEALPVGAVVRSETSLNGDPWVWERLALEGWSTTGSDASGSPDVPALLLWHPGWEAS